MLMSLISARNNCCEIGKRIIQQDLRLLSSMEHGTFRSIPFATGFQRCVTMVTQGKSFPPHLRHWPAVPACVQPEFSLSRAGMRIGGERVKCRASKPTNSLGRTKLTNSLGKQQL